MAGALHVLHEIDAQREARPLDAAIAALAKRQNGIVARSQLVGLGLGRGAIEHRVRCGRLHPLHRGVFAVGHGAVGRDATWLAAVLAAGEGAALSYRSAGALWGMRETARGRIEVSVPRHRRSGARLELHWVSMEADEITTERAIPVTTPARTLFDLAAVLTAEQLEHRLRRGGGPPAREPDLPRCPPRAVPRAQGSYGHPAGAREAPRDWSDGDPKLARAAFPQPRRRPLPPAAADEPRRRQRRA